jgi:hypothetical protein
MAISTIGQNGLNAPLSLTSPALGTPSSINLSNATALPKAALPTGCILQVSQATLAGTQAISGTSTWTDVTSLSVTITPTASTSKFLLSFAINVQGQNNTYFRFVRNGTAIGIGNADGAKSQITSGNAYTGGTSFNSSQTVEMAGQYLDSPATASAITYKVQFYADNSVQTGSAYINYSSHESNNAGNSRAMSTFTVMEVAA